MRDRHSSYIKIKTDFDTQSKLAKLVKENINAYALLMYLCMVSEAAKRDDINIIQFIAYVTITDLADYIGKSEETVRRALNVLKDMDLIYCDLVQKASDSGPAVYVVEAKVNRIQ